MSKSPKINLIGISYAKRALENGTRERERMLRYAASLKEYHLIVFTKRSEGFPAVQTDGNLFLYATNSRTRVGMLWRAYRLSRMILKDHPTKAWVITSQDPFETALVGRAVARGNRATHHVQIHGDVFNPQSYRSSWLQQVRVWYGRRVVKTARCIRVVSGRIKRSLMTLGVSAEKITVLPIHADLEQFLTVGRSRSHVVGDTLSFLYVGRFSPEKNVPCIINVFAALAIQYPKSKLTLLGDGPLRSSLDSLIASKGLQERISIMPWTNDVPGVMAKHEVFCLASNHEGWAMVLLEAAAAGMPIVTTDVGCAGECVRRGENGEVVLVGDESHYKDALEQYLKNPGLVAVQGARSYDIASSIALSEAEYLNQLVESFTSCGEVKPGILAGNGKT